MLENKHQIEYYPLTSSRWSDLEQLFGKHGAYGGCWCMSWKLSSKEFSLNKGEGNKAALKKLVENGEFLGILAYIGDKPVGWCAFGPREGYPRLNRSRILAPVDDEKVWSIVCFFVDRGFRRKGIMSGLIQAAINYAAKQRVTILEAYPVDPKTDRSPDPFVYTGLYSAFQRVGFTEVLRRGETRPILRFKIQRST